jgi:hypothetical protein
MANNQAKNFFMTAGGLAISAVVLFASVWVVSKAWSKGQTKSS